MRASAQTLCLPPDTTSCTATCANNCTCLNTCRGQLEHGARSTATSRAKNQFLTPQHHANPRATHHAALSQRCHFVSPPRWASRDLRALPCPAIPLPCTEGKRSVKPYGKYVENVDAGVWAAVFAGSHPRWQHDSKNAPQLPSGLCRHPSAMQILPERLDLLTTKIWKPEQKVRGVSRGIS